MIHPSRLALLRLWLSERPSLVLLSAVAAIGLIGVTAYYLPIGSMVVTSGTVTYAGTSCGKSGCHYYLDVEVDGREVTIHPFVIGACAVGRAIKLERQRRLWGYVFAADESGCEGAGAV